MILPSSVYFSHFLDVIIRFLHMGMLLFGRKCFSIKSTQCTQYFFNINISYNILLHIMNPQNDRIIDTNQ